MVWTLDRFELNYLLTKIVDIFYIGYFSFISRTLKPLWIKYLFSIFVYKNNFKTTQWPNMERIRITINRAINVCE